MLLPAPPGAYPTRGRDGEGTVKSGAIGLSPPPGPRALEPLTARPGLPVPPRVRGASAARSPWGERETAQPLGARSLAASSAENGGLARPGRGRRRAEGGAGEAGAESAPTPEGDPDCRLGAQPAGTVVLGGVRGSEVSPSPSINYCLCARVPARAASGVQRPPSRPPAPEIKSWRRGNLGHQKLVLGGWGVSEGSRWAPGKGEVRDERGRGQVTAEGGGRTSGGRKRGRSHRGGMK